VIKFFPSKKKKGSSSSLSEDEDDSENDSDDDSDDDDKGKGKDRKKSKTSKKADPKVRRPQNARKTKEERKKEARSHLKKILWTMVYPKIFEKDISNKVVHRKQLYQHSVDEQYDGFAQNFTTWMMNIVQEGFTKLVDDNKKNYDFIGLDFKKLSKSDVTKRSNDCKVFFH